MKKYKVDYIKGKGKITQAGKVHVTNMDGSDGGTLMVRKRGTGDAAACLRWAAAALRGAPRARRCGCARADRVAAVAFRAQAAASSVAGRGRPGLDRAGRTRIRLCGRASLSA